MPYKRNDSPVWWVSYALPSGKRIRRSTGTTDKKEAEALEAKWKLEVYRAAQWDEQPERSFEELMLAYLQATERSKRGMGHRRALDATRHLRAHFGGRSASLRAVDIRGYIAARRQSVRDATINRELSVLSAAINYARRELEWEIVNSVTGRMLSKPEGRLRWLRRSEARQLIQAAETVENAPHLADFIRLALNTGMRKGELLGLDWQRVDIQAGLIHLEPQHTKTGKRRAVPLNLEARGVIINRARFKTQQCPNSPWVWCHSDGSRLQDVKRSFATACKRAGIRDFRIHDLRHTCAAWLVSAGAPLTEVRELLGHSTVKMTERYAHLAPENVRAAVALLDGTRSRFGHAENMEETANTM